ncbi:34199_t:CDS:1, partial [Racocetra persica]
MSNEDSKYFFMNTYSYDSPNINPQATLEEIMKNPPLKLSLPLEKLLAP